jgi:hypothetical protein
MSEETKDNKTQPPTGPEFFIDELARISLEEDRRYISLSRRITALEANKKGMADDPETMMAGIFIVMIGLQLLPLVLDVIRGWQKSAVEKE